MVLFWLMVHQSDGYDGFALGMEVKFALLVGI